MGKEPKRAQVSRITLKRRMPTAMAAMTQATMRRTVMKVFACGTESSSTYALMPFTVVSSLEVEFVVEVSPTVELAEVERAVYTDRLDIVRGRILFIP